ncbi:MAG TPA: TonB-dependent receptor, partial [Opitutaceae bacterium]|nr:TonB-dependent receptor [Opitutaceae bacterium]
STSVAGAAYDYQTSFARQLIGPSLPFNLLAPVYGALPVFNSVTTKQSATSKPWQYYVNEQLGLFDGRLILTAGAVRVEAHTNNVNQLSNVSAQLNDSKNLALFGAVFKVTSNVSVYASRSVNAVPIIANNLPLWQEGQQYEFGVKTSMLNDRLSFTAAHFQIAQTNVTVPNPAFQSDPTQPPSLISDLKNHGYEFEMVGGITDHLTTIASVTYLRERDSLGRPVRAIAERNAALFLNYRFTDTMLKGLSIFAGATYTGRRSGEAPAVDFTPLGVVTQPSFFLAPVTLLNLGGHYTWDKFTFALNIDNAFDKKYIGIPTARTNAGVGLPRNIRLTTTYKF